VVPRCHVRLVAEVEEQREHGLPRTTAGEGGAEQLVEEPRAALSVGVLGRVGVGVGGGEAVQEREALGGDDIVAGPREAAGDGGDSGGRRARGGREAEHLPRVAVVRGRVVVGGGVHDGHVEVQRHGGRHPRDANGRLVTRGGRKAEHLPAPCGWIWQRPGRAPACCCFRCSSCWGLGDGE